MPSLKLLIYGALAVLAVYVAWSLIDLGADRTRNAVERQNNEAARDADDSRLDFDDCPDGMWDFGAGICDGTT